MLVALDGGLGPSVTARSGIYWSRMKFCGDGAHTLNSRGQPNPARAAAQCITDIYTVPLPRQRAGRCDLQRRRTHDRRQRRQRHSAGECRSPWICGPSTRISWIRSTRRSRQVEAARPAHKASFARDISRGPRPAAGPIVCSIGARHPSCRPRSTSCASSARPLPAGASVPTGSTDANAGVVPGFRPISVGRCARGDQHTLQEWPTLSRRKSARSKSFCFGRIGRVSGVIDLADDLENVPPSAADRDCVRAHRERCVARSAAFRTSGAAGRSGESARRVDWIWSVIRRRSKDSRSLAIVGRAPIATGPRSIGSKRSSEATAVLRTTALRQVCHAAPPTSGPRRRSHPIPLLRAGRSAWGRVARGCAASPGRPASNNSSEAQPDAALRALNGQPSTPGPREQVYCTKVGTARPDEIYIVGAHMDGRGLERLPTTTARVRRW